MIPDQSRKFPFLCQQRSFQFRTPIPTAAPPTLVPIIATGVLVHRPFPFHLLLFIFALVARVINLEHSSHDRRTPQVVHCQVRTPLIFIFQKCKSSGFSGFFVPYEVDIHWLAELRKNGDDVPFRELEREPADVDVGCVTIVGMPRCFGGSEQILVSTGEMMVEYRDGYVVVCLHPVFKFALVQILDFTDGIHAIS